MSAGSFLRGIYEQDNGVKRLCRLQPETAACVLNGATNVIPAGPATGNGSVKLRGSRRQYGVYARRATLAFTGTLPEGYSGDNVVVPILTPATFNSFSVGNSGFYLGSPITILSKTGESIR